MKQSIRVVVFIVLAAVIIGIGAWYDNRISASSEQAVASQGEAAAQAQAQQQAAQTQAEQKLMANLKITDLTVGTGTTVVNGDTVNVLYTGTLDNGTVFDASSKHGNTPFSFTVGAGQVIQGWDLGLVGMKVGGKRELAIPPDLGYGANGAGGVIPPNATLHFTIELLSIATSTQ